MPRDDASEALELAGSIASLIEDELPDGAYERGREFFDSALARARAISETVESRAAEGQRSGATPESEGCRAAAARCTAATLLSSGWTGT